MLGRFKGVLLSVILGACGAPGRPVDAAVRAEPLHVIVLHTNDVHGQVLPRRATWLEVPDPPLVGGLPLVAAYVNAVRDEARRERAALFVVDAGDWFQGTPEGRVEGGLAMLRAMAAAGYDAMAVGNHELDRGLAHLVGLLEDSGVPAVCANLVDPLTQERVAWAAPWRVVEREGLRLAFVGLLATETPAITHPDARTLAFAEPAAALAEARRALAGQVDWIVPLTHIGIEADRELARAHADLALIVGGHSHTYLKEGERAGGTLIVQVGAKASAVGRVDAYVDRASGELLAIEARAVDLDVDFPETWRDPEVEHLCAAMIEASAAAMGEVLGELAAPLSRAREPLVSSTAGNLITDAFRERTGADVALMNRGGIRRDIEAGPVTRRDVFELLPFDNHLVTLTLSGAELEQCLRRAVEGGAHSGLEVSGAVLEVVSDPEQPRLLGVRVGGRPLDPAALYRVTLNSFMAQGGDDFLPGGGGRERSEDPILMRELLEQVFVDRGRVVPSDESRYVLVAP